MNAKDLSPAIRYTLDGRTVLDICATVEGANRVLTEQYLTNGHDDATGVTVHFTPKGGHGIDVNVVECDVCFEEVLGVTIVGDQLACPDCRDKIAARR